VDRDREAAFEAFAAGRQAALFRLAFLLSGDRHHAEDLVQGTLERAYQYWRRVVAADNPEAYVRRMLVNAASERRRSRRYVVEQSLDGALVLTSQRDGAADRVESPDVVVRALRGLPARMRAVLVLRYFEDLSEAETASVLDCSVGTVKSQESRGLARLRAATELRPGASQFRDRSTP
jgi:RNA polymerase sigma-70 factor (sigma-E family)